MGAEVFFLWGNSMPSQIMDEKAIERALLRIAHEVVERNRGTQSLIILGIPTRGK